MASTEVLREFLVSLGFQTDEASFKKFLTGVGAVTEPVLKLGAAAAAAATAVEVMVERVATQMSALFYASQRTYAAAASLQAVGFAARQVGLEAGQGTDLLEGLGRALRTNPGTEGLLGALGIGTREANGHLRDSSQILDDLLKRMEHMPRFMALQYGGILGFNPDTLNQVLNNLPQFIRAQDDARRSLREFGLDQTQVSADSVDFERHLHALEQSFDNLTTRVAHDWMPIAEHLIDDVNGLVVRFGEWNDTMSGTPGKIGSIATALLGIVAAFTLLSKIPGFGWLAGFVGAPALGVVAAAAAVGAETYVGTQTIENATHGEVFSIDPITGMPVYNTPLGIRSNNPLNLQPGGKEENFSSPLEGLLAGKAQLLRYGRRGWDTVSAIISHWDAGDTPSRIASYVGDVSHRTGYGPGQRLNLSDPAVMASLMSAMTRHEQGGNPYSASLFARAASSAAVSLSQTTNITVNGSTDPAGTAKKIGDVQGRVNGDIVRNFASVVQ